MKVTVRWHGVPAEVEGLPCGIPGLAITRWIPPDESLSIIHVRSGHAVAFFYGASPEAVLAAAEEIGTLADWTVSGTCLQGMKRLALKTAEIAWRWGGEVSGRARPATDLAGAAS